MKRMRRKFKAMQRDINGKAVDWRTLYMEQKANEEANGMIKNKNGKKKKKDRDKNAEKREKEKKKRYVVCGCLCMFCVIVIRSTMKIALVTIVFYQCGDNIDID